MFKEFAEQVYRDLNDCFLVEEVELQQEEEKNISFSNSDNTEPHNFKEKYT
jgi:hypothetical protein